MSSNTIFSIYNSDGLFVSWTSRPDAEVPFVLDNEDAVGCVEGRFDPNTYWWDGTEVSARPSAGFPFTKTLSVGEEWIPGITVSASIEIDGVNMGPLEIGEPLSFGFAGTYVLTLLLPPQWVDTTCTVEVS